MQTLAREAAVLAMTCELRGMVGVGKETLAGGGDGVESSSVPDPSLRMLSSWATSSTASSSSLGVPRNWRALPILTISSISSWYVLPRSMLFHTLMRAETRALLTASSLENRTDIWVLLSTCARTGEPVRVVEGTCHETTARGGTRLESVVLGVELCIVL